MGPFALSSLRERGLASCTFGTQREKTVLDSQGLISSYYKMKSLRVAKRLFNEIPLSCGEYTEQFSRSSANRKKTRSQTTEQIKRTGRSENPLLLALFTRHLAEREAKVPFGVILGISLLAFRFKGLVIFSVW